MNRYRTTYQYAIYFDPMHKHNQNSIKCGFCRLHELIHSYQNPDNLVAHALQKQIRQSCE